jgi:hypothetical protein
MEPLCATSTAETSEPWQYLQYFEKIKNKKINKFEKFLWDFGTGPNLIHSKVLFC